MANIFSNHGNMAKSGFTMLLWLTFARTMATWRNLGLPCCCSRLPYAFITTWHNLDLPCCCRSFCLLSKGFLDPIWAFQSLGASLGASNAPLSPNLVPLNPPSSVKLPILAPTWCLKSQLSVQASRPPSVQPSEHPSFQTSKPKKPARRNARSV